MDKSEGVRGRTAELETEVLGELPAGREVSRDQAGSTWTGTPRQRCV